MSEFRDEALKKLREGAKNVRGSKETAMKEAVRATLETFCTQDEEFAQAVVQGVENELQAFADRFGTAGKVDDQGSFANHGDAAAEHGAVCNLRGAHTNVFRNAGRISVRDRHRCFRCLVTE